MKTKKRKLLRHMTVAKFEEMKERMEWTEAQFEKVRQRAKAADAKAEAALKELQATSAGAAAEALGHMVAQQRHQQLLDWIKLNKPDLLKLEKAVERASALASAKLIPKVELTVKERRRPHRWQP